jgi:hypothetical protein
MNATEVLRHIPPEKQIRRELGEKLREVAALKELLRIARRRQGQTADAEGHQ